MSLVECSFSQKSILSITWEGELWRHVHTTVFGKKPSLPQHCSTLEDFEQEFFKLEYRLAKAYALRRLSAMSLLSSTLAKSLRTRLISEEVIKRVIQEFMDLGYLNDQEWVQSFARQQIRKKVGPKAIAAKLAAKGIPSDLLEESSCNIFEQDQHAVIGELLLTKYKKRNLSDFRERQKVVAALLRRGFDLGEVLDCLKSHCANVKSL